MALLDPALFDGCSLGAEDGLFDPCLFDSGVFEGEQQESTGVSGTGNIVTRGLGQPGSVLVAHGLGRRVVETVDQPQLPQRRARIGVARVAVKPLKFRVLARGSTAGRIVLQAEYLLTLHGKGTSHAEISGVSERPTVLRATGQSKARISAHAETVFKITATGAVAGGIDLRNESTPVFSDDELMALATWQYLH